MREQRRNIGRFTAGRRVLNTFAYTGALSVAAALAGASEVTSVDLSSGVLAWAEENFRLSGLDPRDPRFRFETSDVRRFLERAQERKLEYDTIIFDPPTVSAARASSWSMKRDYPDLIALGAKLLPAQGGLLWVSGNPRRGPSVMEHVALGLRRAGRPGLPAGARAACRPTTPPHRTGPSRATSRSASSTSPAPPDPKAGPENSRVSSLRSGPANYAGPSSPRGPGPAR